jgi:hypothetical protein
MQNWQRLNWIRFLQSALCGRRQLAELFELCVLKLQIEFNAHREGMGRGLYTIESLLQVNNGEVQLKNGGVSVLGLVCSISFLPMID